MEHNNLIKKGIAVAVILLFIGLAFAPSINAIVSKTSVEDELVEFTTEMCGLNGGKQTVQLTNEEAEEVEALFDSIRSRLNTTETREEAEEIFEEAVVELDKYGLLGDLSIEQAQRLVTGGYQNSKMMKLFEKLNPSISDKEENYLCLIAGNVESISLRFHRLITTALIRAINVIASFASIFEYILLPILLFNELRYWFEIFAPMFVRTPHMGVSIAFGSYSFILSYGYWMNLPAYGWIHTLGLNGIKTWDGSFYGQFPSKWNFEYIYNKWFLGCIGFTGITIVGGLIFSVLLGSALGVKLGYQPP